MGSWGITPKASVEAECSQHGRERVVSGCVDLLEGRGGDAGLLLALAGPPAEAVLRGEAGGPEGYWPRVWGARGLLYAWENWASPSVVAAGRDESWRVREMVMKVANRHMVEDAAEVAARLSEDPVPRVRRAAERALERIVGESA